MGNALRSVRGWVIAFAAVTFIAGFALASYESCSYSVYYPADRCVRPYVSLGVPLLAVAFLLAAVTGFLTEFMYQRQVTGHCPTCGAVLVGSHPYCRDCGSPTDTTARPRPSLGHGR